MKNLFICLLALLTVCSVFSCQKDEPAEDISELNEAHFSVMLNGNPYVVEDGLLAYAYRQNGQISVNGIASLESSETVSIVFPADFSTGTYAMGPEEEVYAIAIIDGISYNTKLAGSNGEVVVTEFDGEQLIGSFHFDAKGGEYLEHSMEAAEGVFSVKLR